MRLLRRVAGWVYLATQILGSVALIGLMLVVGGTVIYRWFGGTFQGSYEVAETFTIVTITMAIFMATVNRSHVDVTIVYQTFGAALRRLVMVVVGALSVGLWALAFYSVWQVAARLSRHGEITDVLRIDIVPFRWVTVAGFAGVTAVLAWQTWQWIAGRGDDGPSGHEAARDGAEGPGR